ncbi:MAG: S41 family peptidase [Chloroflexota bacterium]
MTDHSEPASQPESPSRANPVWRWLLIGSCVLLFAVCGFGAGMLAERYVFSGPLTAITGGTIDVSAPGFDASNPRYAETRALIEEEFLFRPTDPDAEATFAAQLDRGAMDGVAAVAATPVASVEDYQRQLDYGAASGVAEAAGDAYTVFLEPIEQRPLAEQLDGEYEGIGVWVEHPEGQFLVVAPIPGSPAEAAGIRPGDILLEADGVALTGLSEADGLLLIRGPAGTQVTLLIQRPDVPEPITVSVVREKIAIPTVIYEPIADGQIAHISVGIFGDQTTTQLDEALKAARRDGARGIVLDLRGNGGGWVTSAQEMVGRFVPADRGPALLEDSIPGDVGELTEEPIIGGGEEWFTEPMVILVDGGSASASEIVAGALRDYERATLIGQPTFGKGLVQRVHDFEDGSSLRVTFAQWLTPNRTPIPEDGIQPAILVNPPAEGETGDPQLAVAVNELLAALGLPPATPVPVASPAPGATPVR